MRRERKSEERIEHLSIEERRGEGVRSLHDSGGGFVGSREGLVGLMRVISAM